MGTVGGWVEWWARTACSDLFTNKRCAYVYTYQQAVSQPAIFVASAAAIEKLKATEGEAVANSATVRCAFIPYTTT